MLYATGEAEPGAPLPTWRTALHMPPKAREPNPNPNPYPNPNPHP